MKSRVSMIVLAMIVSGSLGNALAHPLGTNIWSWTILGAVLPFFYLVAVLMATIINEDLSIMVGVGSIMYLMVKLTDLLWPGISIEFLSVVAFIGYFVGGVLYSLAIDVIVYGLSKRA